MVGLVTALLVSSAWGWVALRLGPRIGWLDKPDDPALKVHRRPAVPLGGVGIFLAVHIGMLLEGRFSAWLVVASGLLLVVGMVDDRVSVSPGMRLLVETFTGLLLAWAVGARTPIMLLLVTGLVVVAVNAVNLLDGLDGLAGLTGAIAAAGLAWLALARGSDPYFGTTLLAALAGFLIWNWHPARVFLGDNGAYVLAIFLVYGILDASVGPWEVAVAIGVFGVFLVDLVATLSRRLIGHRALFSGDRLHLYDRLVDHGLTVPKVAATAGVLQAVLVALVVLTDRVLEPPVSVLVLLAVGLGLVAFLATSLRDRGKGRWRGTRSQEF